MRGASSSPEAGLLAARPKTLQVALTAWVRVAHLRFLLRLRTTGRRSDESSRIENAIEPGAGGVEGAQAPVRLWPCNLIPLDLQDSRETLLGMAAGFDLHRHVFWRTGMRKEEMPQMTASGDFSSLRVAIVQHWFVSKGGAERVVDAIAEMFPNAAIVSPIIHKQSLSSVIKDRKLITSWLSNIPGVHRFHRHTLPLQAFAVESLDLSEYDLVLTSDAGPAKGILTNPSATHICYCHSPMRYIWDMYPKYSSELSPLVRSIFKLSAHYMRMWDYAAAARVDEFISNSNYVSRRIEKFYRRPSTVIYPPVDVQGATVSDSPQDFYLAVGRLVPYKRMDLAVRACTALHRPLRVIGEGPEMKRLKAVAGPTVEFLGRLPDDAVREHYAQCRALLFPSEEDFGIVPVEANAAGRPVIAFGKGGALESIRGIWPDRREAERDYATGVFFRDQTADSLATAMLHFEAIESEFMPAQIHEHAMKFDKAMFQNRFADFVQETLLARGVEGTFEVAARSSSGTKVYSDTSLVPSSNTSGQLPHLDRAFAHYR